MNAQVYPDARHVLFPIKNADFITLEEYPSFKGYVNYYDGAFGTIAGPATPFPYLPYVLTKAVEAHGYSLLGSWLSEEDTCRTAIYNTVSVGESPDIIYNKHVPEMKVSEFMQAIRSGFALSYLFDANTNSIKIVKLKEVIATPAYVDWTKKADLAYGEEPVDYNGFKLEQALEADELNKTLSTAWHTFAIGGGKEIIPTAIGGFHMVREQDPVKPSREWLIPATSQKGNQNYLEQNKFSLRLLKYYGLQKDSQNIDYPLGSVISENYAGAALAGNSLRWDGVKGLYENNYKPWLDFLSTARPIERNVRLDIADLLTLDPTKKVMIEGVKAFWSKISLSVSMKEGIGKAKVEFLKTKL